MFRTAYDRDVTTWSPEGRLHQVEYAMKSIQQGSCCLGLLGKNYVVLAAYKRQTNKLGSAQKKIFKIDDHLGIAIAGITADARTLAQYMRTECLNHKYFYNSPAITGRLANDLADKAQQRTQGSWNRPYGVGLLIAGIDKDGAHLYQTCPSGNLYEVKGMAIGDRSTAAKTYLESHVNEFEVSSKEELMIHALKALRNAMKGYQEDTSKASTEATEQPEEGQELNENNVALAVIGVNDKFEIFENEKIAPFLARITN